MILVAVSVPLNSTQPYIVLPGVSVGTTYLILPILIIRMLYLFVLGVRPGASIILHSLD